MSATIRPDAISVSTNSLMKSPMSSLPELGKLERKMLAPRAPRIDVEPLYAAVKGGMGEVEWGIYKGAIGQFMIGNLNQEELTHKLAPVLHNSTLERAHNQFVTAIYANIFRDPPEAGIASWVSSTDKPTTTAKTNTGDEAEKRLKHEIMQLSRRERKRLKTVHQGETSDPFTHVMQEYHDARRIKQPETGPASAGGYQKTNWDLEIRKRYTSALFAETHEFPTANTIQTRMLPICYEAGLPSGHTNDCAEYMNIATETYIKEALTNLFQRVSSNGGGFVKTAEYKRKVEREEERIARGELGRGVSGELPIEVEERRKRPPLCMEDLRLALELGDSYLGQVPLISGAITNARFLDAYGVEELAMETQGQGRSIVPVANGVPNLAPVSLLNGTADGNLNGNNAALNNYHFNLDEPTVDFGDDWTWKGGEVQDVDGLDGVLDGCLAIGI
ncbi:hypothetical protein K504DRAFT_465133 [Pleomassaria siparia CBS 279.74]|uniref:Transcriptional co-activator n=1 Tax=Pleomassaria siparia CBS 279.74 TaxID=1314801 RepID=A0A6G1KG82_9PLEO|nr:hypothetical protein K504DRAFT_465133 [Pleomassaria siparia CBS 279.74]